MPDLQDGESTEMQGSGSKPYILKNTGGVYSCTCPAWRNQSIAIEKRTCKHLRKLRGDAAEETRIGGALPQRPAKSWDNATDLTNWWMSEKLDGMRAYGTANNFSRARATSITRPIGSSKAFPQCRSTVNSGSTAKNSNAPSALSAAR